MTYKKAIILSDLDDTFFQTKRKMLEASITPYRMAALDREAQPRSFMSESQANLVDWLLATSEVIPVTARGSDEFARIDIKFSSYKIACHGAVIINPDNSLNADWQKIVEQYIERLTPKILALKSKVEQLINDAEIYCGKKIDAWARINEENGLPIYLVCKVRDSLQEADLAILAEMVEKEFDLSDFYIHRNRNNLAFLPKLIAKENATKYLLEHLIVTQGRPILSFGDSFSDLPFMALSDFLCVPRYSQVSDKKALIVEGNHVN